MLLCQHTKGKLSEIKSYVFKDPRLKHPYVYQEILQNFSDENLYGNNFIFQQDFTAALIVKVLILTLMMMVMPFCLNDQQTDLNLIEKL